MRESVRACTRARVPDGKVDPSISVQTVTATVWRSFVHLVVWTYLFYLMLFEILFSWVLCLSANYYIFANLDTNTLTRAALPTVPDCAVQFKSLVFFPLLSKLSFSSPHVC